MELIGDLKLQEKALLAQAKLIGQYIFTLEAQLGEQLVEEAQCEC